MKSIPPLTPDQPPLKGGRYLRWRFMETFFVISRRQLMSIDLGWRPRSIACRLAVDIDGSQWTSMGVNRCQWPSMAVNGRQSTPTAVNGQQGAVFFLIWASFLARGVGGCLGRGGQVKKQLAPPVGGCLWLGGARASYKQEAIFFREL